MLLGVLILGEPCDPKTVAGGILITAGALCWCCEAAASSPVFR